LTDVRRSGIFVFKEKRWLAEIPMQGQPRTPQMEMNMSLASLLKDLRSSSGQSLQQVADKVGASKAHLSELERGVATNPTIDLLRALAANFGVSVSALIGEADSPPPLPPVAGQVEAWMNNIRKEQAAGLDLETAAREARASFERLLGPLDAQHEANWKVAVQEMEAAFEKKIEYLGNFSLRKPRRPHWYDGPRAGDQHWPKLEAYLLTRKGWPKETVASIDATSTEVVSLLENPLQSTFRGRGMVVGYVQSGKTANMEAVIAKAVDAGYRFVIILTGMTNSLRTQTQDRIEVDLLERNKYGWHLHTTSDADFRKPASKWFSTMDAVQIAAVKKNVSPLEALLNTIEKTPPTHRARMPVLIIDDECDQAGVNASGSQFNMTSINALIRKILHALPKVQYVGYTATPFANVLINPEKPAGGLDDLYPEDFITDLPRPENYFGPESLFGRDPIDADEETPEEAGLDLIRDVPDDEVALVRPSSAKDRLTFEPAIPLSLEKALSYFVLATACRYVRGQTREHSSMLVHTTVYTHPHHALAEKILSWKEKLAKKISKPDRSTVDRLEKLWLKEVAKVDAAQFGLVPVSFAALREHLEKVLSDIEIVVENSDSESRLEYASGPKKYIVVGGSVLARGLTIEGLIVSYFVRSSTQYDTLLQMGRWFGFRFGYQDLPRIWMTGDLRTAFKDLATVEAEIRADIQQYRKRDVTPADFAIRIRRIPGMVITAAKKMYAAKACDVSFSGEHIQTIRFPHQNKDFLSANWKACAHLLSKAAELGVEQVRGGRLIRKVPYDLAMEFLKTYSSDQRDLISGKLLEYIGVEAARADQPYEHWNVAIVEPANGPKSLETLGAFGKVGLVNRARLQGLTRDGLADIKALMSRQDVLMDVTGVPDDLARDWGSLKEFRQEKIGDRVPLLLLYAIHAKSTPKSVKLRVPLDAVRDILGIGLILPERGPKTSYVRVVLDQDDGNEMEDLQADIESDAGGQAAA
jgi:transcriptional regulator with XRE-family HTH domain